MVRYRTGITGSHIGGIAATEEVLELCGAHGILPDIQHIEANQLDWAWEQLNYNKTGLRYILDVKKSLQNKDFLPSE